MSKKTVKKELPKSVMVTYTGKRVNLLHPTIDTIDIRDIGIALSRICRVAGHTKPFYSVAQHSVLVAREMMSQTGEACDALIGLLHDAPEAYIADFIRPVRQLFSEYELLERGLWEAVRKKIEWDTELELDTGLRERIFLKTIDDQMLVTERFQLFDHPIEPEDAEIFHTIQPLSHIKIQPWGIEESYSKFIGAYEELVTKALGYPFKADPLPISLGDTVRILVSSVNSADQKTGIVEALKDNGFVVRLENSSVIWAKSVEKI